ncbi:hypothetical protein LTR10_024282 [Elasticomyces elasticus]|uniref:Cytochrome P450 n=1 Tax=Exophiala sideris TaxID=1016849 RepID=A0ABR0IU37_9EURO|nr:hypothetical protein LTR10_024282 [Elasticomyces elasticus]KAK5020732.1 hypothetical protein LTS07_011462 [Exophiala sideris]KAK5022582.1 hypothetical protein LTR13_011440 [Exophiala sideris]KAK5048099.1 hypothetical protein LTR69_011467 [Exophiala sideris]KAK5175965.1 hypothetical protein LTR44_011472 [Eurotiomycetes sp. CCFEE 6388]
MSQLDVATLFTANIIRALLVAGVVALVWGRFSGHGLKLSHLPLLGQKGQANFYKALEDAYYNCKSLRRIPMRRHDIVWVPPKFISEVSALPESKVSVALDSATRFHGKYTGLGIIDFHFVDVIRIHVTRNLAKMFVPEDLAKNSVWVDLMINYTVVSMQAVEELHSYPMWTHPVVARFLPKCRVITDYRRRARDLLRPILEERRRLVDTDPTFVMPPDTLSWIIKEKGEGGWDPDYQARVQILIGVGSIHTTTNALSNTLFDIISTPGVTDELRTEYIDTLAANGGKMNKIALNSLVKFDSVMRESQRLNPSHAIAIGRMTTADLKLSDGEVVPRNTHFLFSSAAANKDPSVYASPDVFDPWRFVKLREAETNKADEGKWQFVATGPNSLGFGHGTHACPGRFFASNEMRLILGNLLLRYEFKFGDGIGRPRSLLGETTILPDTKTKVLIKSCK